MNHKKLRQYYQGNVAWENWLPSQGNILLHWRLGEASLASPAADASGNGRSGTYGTVEKMTAGIAGLVTGTNTCVRWDDASSAYAQVSIADATDALSPAAVSYEVVSNAIAADATNRCFFNKNNLAGIAFVKFGALGIRVYTGGAIYTSFTFADATPFTGRSHWLVVYDGSLAAASRLKIYRNGSLLATSITGTVPATITGDGAALRVGTTTSTGFLGQMDEFMIHGVARSPAYAMESYTRALP